MLGMDVVGIVQAEGFASLAWYAPDRQAWAGGEDSVVLWSSLELLLRRLRPLLLPLPWRRSNVDFGPMIRGLPPMRFSSVASR